MPQVTTPKGDAAVRDATATKRPPRYKVLLLNDDYTTMEFVIIVLVRVFKKRHEDATRIMLHVHQRGIGVAGIYVKEIAEMKCDAVHKLARANGFPLRCDMEPE